MFDDALRRRIHECLAAYYAEKLQRFGATPRGVDWRDQEGQELRFAQLLRICGDVRAGSLIELGCGYAALHRHLRRHAYAFNYTGYDLSKEMVGEARTLLEHDPSANVVFGSRPDEAADFCVASGIFNIRFEFPDAEWRRYVFETLDQMAEAARLGFAFNMLTRFSDLERRESRLYYADPGDILSHCLSSYGRHVTLIHGHGLHEFTVLVRKGDLERD